MLLVTVGELTVIADCISPSANTTSSAVPTTPPADTVPVMFGLLNVIAASLLVVIFASFSIRPTNPPAFPLLEVTVAPVRLTPDFISRAVPIFITPITPPAFPAADALLLSYPALDVTV